MGLRLARVQIVNDDGDRLGRVSRCFQNLQAHASEFERVAVAKRSERVTRLRRRAEADRRADAIAQFQMSGDKIGVQVSEEHVFDFEPVYGGECDVLIDVALGVNHYCGGCLLVSDHVGRVRETGQVELFQDQCSHSLPKHEFGCCEMIRRMEISKCALRRVKVRIVYSKRRLSRTRSQQSIHIGCCDSVLPTAHRICHCYLRGGKIMAKKNNLKDAAVKIGSAVGRVDGKAHKAASVAKKELAALEKQVNALKKQLQKSTQNLKSAFR